MYRHGWYQLAFAREVEGEVSPAAVGTAQLVVVRTPNGVRVADATCPHRGADLAFGGRVVAEGLVCPFHGFRIGLGRPSDQGLCVREYRTLTVGDLVFVQMSDEFDNGFAGVMEKLGLSLTLIPGFSLKVRTPPEMVIENAFDQAHFGPVHGIGISRAFQMRPSERGELAVEGMFELPPSPWQRGRPGPEGSPVPFLARAFSPGIVISDLGGAYPYAVITAATPTPEGSCVIRLSLGLPPAEDGGRPRPELVEYLARRSRAGIDKDRIVWEHLTAPSIASTPLDEPVREFRDFCARFAGLVLA